MTRRSQIRTLLVYALDASTATLSYQNGWPEHVDRHPGFSCVRLNLLDRGSVATIWPRLVARPQFDAVLLLHSVWSNGPHLHGRLRQRIAALGCAKVFCIGNEYKLMPPKLDFADELGITLLVSQSESSEIHRLYRDRLGCAVVGIPNTGVDLTEFRPTTPRAERPIEIGYRAYDAPWYLGHRERREIAEVYADAAARRGLCTDLSLDPADRLATAGWATFLNRCRGQLGCEAGGDYFELDDSTRLAVNAYVEANPSATFEEVFGRFFARYGERISGRMLSGRVVEAAATKTVQILLEGEYGGYFEPDVHYITARKDFANVDETLDKLADDALCRELAERAHEVVSTRLTWGHLVTRLHGAVSAVAG
jgi:hypothetical protein